jgi:hypothetical protein
VRRLRAALEQAEIDPRDQPDAEQAENRSAERAEDADTDSVEAEQTGTQLEGDPEDRPSADPDSIGLGVRAPERAEAMTVVIRASARATAVFLFVAGLYLAVRPNLLEPVELAGTIGIIAIGVLGLLQHGSMFANQEQNSRSCPITSLSQ